MKGEKLKFYHTQKIKSLDELKQIVDRLKSENKKIVFTNGCFDILHLGHIKSLQEAKSHGDVLIVGLNSDASVRRLKGKGRPIQQEADRAQILAAIHYVDYVIIFDEDTPFNLIKTLRPDILVKGGDYKRKEDIVGSDIVEKVIITPFIEGKSTTSLLKRIKEKNKD
jgi:D-beta-D-heptose 7-phosphate kinase/D-beta-D-heptose 1-phosphate adenosyltransferase